MNYRWHTIHSLWYHTTLWHHTPCIHVIKPSIFDIASTVAVSLLTVHWLYHVCNMCDIKPTIRTTNMNYIWHHIHSLWHHKTLLKTSHPLYSWYHTYCIWHHIQCIWHHIHWTYDITATVSMTRHWLCLWHHTQYIWHLTWCMIDNTTTASDMTPTVSV